MTKEQLQRAKEIMSEIGDCEYQLKNISKMLEDNSKYYYLSSENCGTRYAADLDKKTFEAFCEKVKQQNETKKIELQLEFSNL